MRKEYSNGELGKLVKDAVKLKHGISTQGYEGRRQKERAREAIFGAIDSEESDEREDRAED
ncbi:hypothetical protein HYW76_00095 [Candidatus Pacearchaeota archaeon]|nr:hypothetical protein [Candidatus Pacearchaeota archaeon]